MTRHPRRILVLFLWCVAWWASVAQAADAGAGKRAAHPPGAVVASAHALATEAGLEAIRKGGNAFDAAIAVSPRSRSSNRFPRHRRRRVLPAARCEDRPRCHGRRARNRAGIRDARRLPRRHGELDRDRRENGPWSAGIPGLPAALVHIAIKYGRLPLRTTLAPAIRIARDGFRSTRACERGYGSRREVMERYAGTRAVYLADGDAAQGRRNPQAARTRAHARTAGGQGLRRLLQGRSRAEALAGVNSEGGKWTAGKLASYRVRNARRCTSATTAGRSPRRRRRPPGGIALAQMLQVLSGWNLHSLDPAPPHAPGRRSDAARLPRSHDLPRRPRFREVPVARLMDPNYAAGLRASIHPDKATPSDLFSGKPAPLEDDETTHFAIIDAKAIASAPRRR
jgi:gamma-glutamyltranspeptidase/glutathione hydrolase